MMWWCWIVLQNLPNDSSQSIVFLCYPNWWWKLNCILVCIERHTISIQSIFSFLSKLHKRKWKEFFNLRYSVFFLFLLFFFIYFSVILVLGNGAYFKFGIFFVYSVHKRNHFFVDRSECKLKHAKHETKVKKNIYNSIYKEMEYKIYILHRHKHTKAHTCVYRKKDMDG